MRRSGADPAARTRGIDGGKLIKGVRLPVICDEHGSLLDLELRPADVDDRAGSGFKGAPFAAAALAHDVHVSASPCGTRDGRFLPAASVG